MPPITRSKSKKSTDGSATREDGLSELRQEPGSNDNPLQRQQLLKRRVPGLPRTTRSRLAQTTDELAPKKARLPESNTESRSEDIPQLNDDCLLKTFSYLPLDDLCAVSDCSQRFRELADSTVRALWRDGSNVTELNEFVHVLYNYDVHLSKFAHCTRHMHINCLGGFKPRYFHEHFSVMLRNYDSLISLKLGYRVSLSLISRRWIALQNIERLDLIKCNGNTLKHVQLAMACPKLKYLTLKMAKINAHFLTSLNDHEKIECIEILAHSITMDGIKTPLQLNKLKKLTLEYLRIRDQNRFIRALARNDSLDELNLKVMGPNDGFFKNFNRFRNLKMCTLLTADPISTAQQALAAKFTFEEMPSDQITYQVKYQITPNKM